MLTTSTNAQFESQNIDPTPLPLNELKIHDLDNSFCIVRDVSTQQCLLTVFQYNNWCEIFKSRGFRRNDGKDSARKIAIDMSLENIYYLMQARKSGLDSIPSVVKEANVNAQNAINDLETKNNEALYEKFQKECFAPKNESAIQLLGSSDSLIADSLLKLYTNEGKDKSKTGTCKCIPISRVPYDILKNIDSLTPGRIKSIATPYGFFVIQVQNTTIASPEISFSGAQPMLHQLAVQENMGVYNNSFLRAYYNEHAEDFSVPDTLDLQVWFGLPKKDVTNPINSRLLFIRNASEMAIDTARQKARVLTQWSLPDPIRAMIEKQDSLFRIIKNVQIENTVFGTWYIRLLTVRKGNGQVPFGRIQWKNISQKHLETLYEKWISDIRDSYFSYYLAAKAQSDKQKSVRPPTKTDLVIVAQHDSIDTTGFNPGSNEKSDQNGTEKKVPPIKKTLLEMRHNVLTLEKDIRTWRETVAIDARAYNIR
jgi:hypothetical protein